MNATTADPNAMTAPSMNPANKLYRSTSDRKLFGVCGGIAEQYNLDPTLVRLGVAFLGLAGGTAVPLYFLAALVIPELPAAKQS